MQFRMEVTAEATGKGCAPTRMVANLGSTHPRRRVEDTKSSSPSEQGPLRRELPRAPRRRDKRGQALDEAYPLRGRPVRPVFAGGVDDLPVGRDYEYPDGAGAGSRVLHSGGERLHTEPAAEPGRTHLLLCVHHLHSRIPVRGDLLVPLAGPDLRD